MLFPEATPFPDNCFLPAWTATRRVRARHEEPQDIRRRLVPDARLAPTAYATRSGIEHHLSERTARAANVERTQYVTYPHHAFPRHFSYTIDD
jgi:hypothetical protein